MGANVIAQDSYEPRKGNPDYQRPPNGKHPYSAKIHALSVYAETLSTTTASARTGIPATTIHEWLKEEDSDAYIVSLRSAVRAGVAHKLVEASVLAADAMIERLNNGDEHYDAKSGAVIRLKVKAKDCASIANTAIDKFTLLTGVADANNKAGKVLQMIEERLIQAIAGAQQLPNKQADTPSDPVDNAK